MLLIGLILFIVGVYISPNWTITGTAMGVIGGLVMGSSTYFFIKINKNNR